MYLHAHQTRPLMLASSSQRPITFPYLISQPLPANITGLSIKIVSHDQGFCDDPSAGTFTWFAASILRSPDDNDREPIEYNHPDLVRDNPRAFTQTFEDQGWHFVHTERQGKKPADCNDPRVGKKICSNAISANWQTHDWSSLVESPSSSDAVGGDASNFAALIRKGDRIIVWACSQFPGWQNFVKEARLELSLAEAGHSSVVAPTVSQAPRNFKWLERNTAKYTLTYGVDEIFPNDLTLTSPVTDATRTHITSTTPPSTDTSISHRLSESETQATNVDELLAVHPCAQDNARLEPTDILIHELKIMHPGDWIICGHDCGSLEHGHPVGECETVTAGANDDNELRGVRNPCSHHVKIDADKEIRQLRICPGDHADPVQLIVWHQTGPVTREDYAALSYCWGDLRQTDEITLNHVFRFPASDGTKAGICFRHTYNITRSLHRALRVIACNARTQVREEHLGGTETERPPYWVDAICIDQKNARERARQVARMGQIYSRASMVLVWLYLDPVVCEKAFRAIGLLSKALKEVYGAAANGLNLTKDQFEYLGKHSPIGHMYCDQTHTACLDSLYALFDLFSNPWFRRVWVIQEICMAGANAAVFAPSHLVLDFADLLLGYRYCAQRYTQSGDRLFQAAMPEIWYHLVTDLVDAGKGLRLIVAPGGKTVAWPVRPETTKVEEDIHLPRDILDIFARTLPFEATDGRDKLFALMGLLSQDCKPDVKSITYEQSPSAVFVDFSRWSVRHSCNLVLFEGVRRTARLPFYLDHLDILPEGYEFPPHGHPTWALWHACKSSWTADVGHPPQHQESRVANKFDVDLELLDCDPNPLHLMLAGLHLDEVATVILSSGENDTSNVSFVPRPETRRPLQHLWQKLSNVFQSDGYSSEAMRTYPHMYATSDNLFHNFMHTVLCDMFLHTIGGEQEIRCSQNIAIMDLFLGYWLNSADNGIDTQERTVLDSGLPPAAVAVCLKLVEDGTKVCQPSAGLFEQALHHILGQSFIITKKGFIGLAPVGTRPGDRIVALHGAQRACVLRGCEEVIDWSIDGRGWMWVGEVFVHAWVDGKFAEQVEQAGDGSTEVYVLV